MPRLSADNHINLATARHVTMPSVSHTRLLAARLALETDAAFFTQNEGIYIWRGKSPIEDTIKRIFDLSFSSVAAELHTITGNAS